MHCKEPEMAREYQELGVEDTKHRRLNNTSV